MSSHTHMRSRDQVATPTVQYQQSRDPCNSLFRKSDLLAAVFSISFQPLVLNLTLQPKVSTSPSIQSLLRSQFKLQSPMTPSWSLMRSFDHLLHCLLQILPSHWPPVKLPLTSSMTIVSSNLYFNGVVHGYSI